VPKRPEEEFKFRIDSAESMNVLTSASSFLKRVKRLGASGADGLVTGKNIDGCS
jgi:hypothetical protein